MPSNDDEHICRWNDCNTEFPDAETLYEHITGGHIGRKSSGTLSLECHWHGCTSKASKRDHLTSHVRVHINLKPHTCPICSKSFKRPQDLKKHEKIHTEEHHAHHKHSKAVTIPGTKLPSSSSSETTAAVNGANSSSTTTAASRPTAPDPTTAAAAASAAATAAANNVAAASAYNEKLMQSVYPGYSPYPPGFPYLGHPQHSMYPQAPNLGQLDVAQLIEHQRQMNAHVVSAAYGLPPSYGLPMFPPPGTYPASLSQGLPSHPAFAPNGMPTPFSFSMYHPNQHPLQFASLNPAAQPHHLHDPSSSPPPITPSSTSLYPSASSLYPSLPGALARSINGEADSPSSCYGSIPSPAPSASPKPVPSLSPASVSNGYSPGPEDHDSLFSTPAAASSISRSTHAIAGQKRAFEDAAGDFFADIKNRRLEDDYKSHVENIDALSLLLTPNDFVTQPMISQRPPSVHQLPEYNPNDVDHINNILANLAQNIDELDRTPSNQSSHSSQNSHSESLARSHLHQHSHSHSSSFGGHGSSMYPTLPQASTFDRPLAPLPSRSAYQSHDNSGLASVRLAKTPAAPSFASDESTRHHPTYLHMERLNRAAPAVSSSFAYRSRTASMDIDDDADDSAVSSRSSFQRKGYATSLRSTSMDDNDVPEADGPELVKLAPIKSLASTHQPTTLPHLRDMLNFGASPSPEPRHQSLSPALSHSSSSSTSSSSFGSLYPSIAASGSSSSASTIRPSTAGSSMERLVPRFTKISVNTPQGDDFVDEPESLSECSIKPDDSASCVDDEPEDDDVDELSGNESEASTDDERATIVSKKSRVEHEAAANKSAAAVEAAQLKARRLATLRALVLHFNDAFRRQVASKAVAQQQQQQKSTVSTSS